MKKLNDDLKEKGFIVLSGRVSRKYLEEMIYGYPSISDANKEEIVDDNAVLNAISSGLKKTLNLWHYWTPKSDVRCLCYRCLQEYMDTPNYSISRVDPFQKVKDSCDRCGRPGYDYTLKEKKRKA